MLYSAADIPVALTSSRDARQSRPGTHEHQPAPKVQLPVFIGSGLAACARAPE